MAEKPLGPIPPELSQPIKNFVARNSVIILILICLIIGYVSVLYFGNDNILEEEMERIIKSETGMKIDLTP